METRRLLADGPGGFIASDKAEHRGSIVAPAGPGVGIELSPTSVRVDGTRAWFEGSTAKRCHGRTTPLSSCGPTSSKTNADPSVRSRTVDVREDLLGVGERCHPCSYHDGDPRHVVAMRLHLAGMDPSSQP